VWVSSHLWRKCKQLLYRLGWLTPYARVDRNRYLRRLRRGRFSDSRYLALEDRAQFVDDEVVVRIDDAGRSSYFHCHPRSSLEDMLIKHGFFQKAVFETMVPFIRPGSIVLDIGANVGAYAIPLARRFPDAEVHAFEPNPPVVARLEENLALNGMAGRNVKVIPLALADVPGRFTLQAVARMEDNYGLSSLREASLGNVDRLATEVEVDTLDRLYLESERPVALVKLDVQGYELQVMRGGKAALSKFRPVIIFEHEDRLFQEESEAAAVKAAISGFMDELGYRCYYISRYGGELLTRVAWQRPLNGDVLAVPFGAPLPP
jgi:FkbM family methyltransferase